MNINELTNTVLILPLPEPCKTMKEVNDGQNKLNLIRASWAEAGREISQMQDFLDAERKRLKI